MRRRIDSMARLRQRLAVAREIFISAAMSPKETRSKTCRVRISRSRSGSSAMICTMRDWRSANQRGRHGAHSYTPEEFGLSEAEIRAAFA